MAAFRFQDLGIVLLATLACAKEPVESASPAPDPPRVATVASQGATSGAVVSGTTTPATGGFPAVVTLEPAGGVEGAATGAAGRGDASAGSGDPLPGGAGSSSVFMDQIAGAFYPPTLLARVGQPVQFFNSEGIMHSVNVASDSTRATVFNIATPPGFEAYTHVFDEPGVYRVTCDIHPNMSAFIVAVTAPYAAVADRDGRFRLEGVAPGSYQASVWSLDASRQVKRPVEVRSGSATVELDLQPGGAAE
jgi:high-affinity iron transporter